jgi:hypothetical protein
MPVSTESVAQKLHREEVRTYAHDGTLEQVWRTDNSGRLVLAYQRPVPPTMQAGALLYV